jgi:OOP family OmpA-OmpF porin
MIRLAVLLVLLPGLAAALSLDFPGNAVMVAQEVKGVGSYDLPVGPWRDGALDAAPVEGTVTRQVWQIAAPGVSTLQILSPLRQQLRREGFEVALDCQTRACGGFDFRFGTEVAAPPDMIVDLADFRFLSARKGAGEEAEAISLMISRTEDMGFVQLIHVGSSAGAAALANTDAPALRQTAPAVTAPTGSPDAPADGFGDRLDRDGHVVLGDLTFDSGSAQLGPGPYDSLRELAAYLEAHPGRTVALVGHTDASGGLEANIALSKRRAGSVLERLVSDYAIPRAQLDAQGMGYLAPVATNLTPEGREANRRVEVIVTSTE